MHMRKANKCAKTKCEYAMEENHVYSAKDRENQSSQAYEIFILYIHVQIVAESKVLWLFQFCRKKQKLWETFVLKHGSHHHIT